MSRQQDARQKINKEEFMQLLERGTSRQAIAMWFGMSDRSVARWIKDNYNCSYRELRNEVLYGKKRTT